MSKLQPIPEDEEMSSLEKDYNQQLAAASAAPAAPSAAAPAAPSAAASAAPSAAASAAPSAAASAAAMPEIDKEQKLYTALANLFQWLNIDEVFEKHKDSGKVVGKETVRGYYEKKLAATSSQRILSQNLSDGLGNPSTAAQILSKSNQLVNNYKLPGANSASFKTKIGPYSRHYCWLSGIKITDEDATYANVTEVDKTGVDITEEKYFTNDRCLKVSQTVNEDEHAVSFYVMLIFFGGISSVPSNNYSSEYKEYFRLVNVMKRKGRIKNNFELKSDVKLSPYEKYIYDAFMQNIEAIKAAGGDFNLISRTYQFSTLLLNFMGIKGANRGIFFTNKEKLNYYGLWPSFCYLNQFKSNFDMIRLGFKINNRNGKQYLSEPYFKPSNTLIENFVDYSDAIIKGASKEQAREIRREPLREEPATGGGRIFFYNRTNTGLSYKYENKARHNPHFAPHWSTQ